MTLNRFALILVVGLLPGLVMAASTPLQDASQLFHQGKNAQALEKVNSYLATNAKDPQGRFLKGLIQAEMNQTDEAIKTFTSLTNDYPELPEPYNNLAVLYASQGQYEQAKNSLEKAIRTNPTYATAHENLGDIYAKMASQAYDKALQLDHSNTSAQMKLSLVKDIFTPAAIDKTASAKHMPAKTAALATTTSAGAAAPTSAAKPDGAGQYDAAVEKAIRDWAAAWSDRNVDAYLSFYADNFTPPQGMSRQAWQAQRKQRLTSPEYIRVGVSDFAIQRNGNHATAEFNEQYESNLLKVNAGKVLTFELQAGAWKIVSER
jgi:tetratricopeptide (TPR) repeat protein